MNDTQQAITDALVAEGRPAEDLVVTWQTPLAEGGLELTSLDLVRALIRIEELLLIELDELAITTSPFQTVGDVADIVARSAPARS